MPKPSKSSSLDTSREDDEMNDFDDSSNQINTSAPSSSGERRDRDHSRRDHHDRDHSRSDRHHGGGGREGRSDHGGRGSGAGGNSSKSPSTRRSKGMGSKSASDRFRRTSKTNRGSKTKMWKHPRGGSDSVDQSVNLMDRTSFELKESHSKRGSSRRGERTTSGSDSYWETQSLGASLRSIGVQDYKHRMNQMTELPEESKQKYRKWCLLVVLGAALCAIITALILTVPTFGLVHHESSSSSPPPPASPAPQKKETSAPETTTESSTSKETSASPEGEEQVPAQSDRLEAFKFYVVDQDVTPEAQLNFMSSSSNKALHWIAQEDPAQLKIPGHKEASSNDLAAEYALLQRYALACFYYSQQQTGSSSARARAAGRSGRRLRGHYHSDEPRTLQAGQQLPRNKTQEELANRQAFDDSWLSVKPICDWHGVKCADDSQTVLEINLPGHLLQGTIPREVLVGSAMPHLEKVDLSNNQLHGRLPIVTKEREDAGKSSHIQPPDSKLISLKLGANRLSGNLGVLSGFPQLEILNLEDNNFIGELPTEALGDLKALEHLELSGNYFTGELPPTLSTMTKLTVLTLSGNDFTGTIPSTFGKLGSLEKLHLDGTAIEGKVPNELGQLLRLTHLHLDGTSLTGEMPQEVCALEYPAFRLRSVVVPCDDFTCDCCTECF